MINLYLVISRNDEQVFRYGFPVHFGRFPNQLESFLVAIFDDQPTNRFGNDPRRQM